MSISRTFIALTALAAAVLLLPACHVGAENKSSPWTDQNGSFGKVTTTGAITRTQRVVVPRLPAGFVSLRLKRAGTCAVDPASVKFDFNTKCKPGQPGCESKELTPKRVKAGNAYCSGTNDFCARCIKVYNFKHKDIEFTCLEYAATISEPRSHELPQPARFLQCIDANGNDCNENRRMNCETAIDAFFSKEL